MTRKLAFQIAALVMFAVVAVSAFTSQVSANEIGFLGLGFIFVVAAWITSK